jgi:hypothetical protein
MNQLELKQEIIEKIKIMEHKKLAFLNTIIDSLDIYLKSLNINNNERFFSGEEKKKFIKSLKGKYAFVKISSDEFAIRKQEEIDWEECN